MQDHPQIKVFRDAASMLRAERYWDYGSTYERVEFLRALAEVVTEVCYHLDVNGVLLDVGQGVVAPDVRTLRVQSSAELLLMTCLDRRIEQLIAVPSDSRNTGAEGSSST